MVLFRLRRFVGSGLTQCSPAAIAATGRKTTIHTAARLVVTVALVGSSSTAQAQLGSAGFVSVTPSPQRSNIPAFARTATPSASQLRMSSSATADAGKKRVLVPIGDDSEEIETSCISDTLTRFGASVVVASVKPDGELVCKMSRGIKVMADVTIADAAKEEWDLIALPGGMPGAEHLRDSKELIELLQKQRAAKKLYGAVCASPAVVLATHNLVDEGATCYPAPPLRDAMKNPVNEEVVVTGDGVVTSQGPGTSLKFALKLGALLYGENKASEIATQLLVHDEE